MLKAFEHMMEQIKARQEERDHIAETGVVTAVDCQLVPDMGGEVRPCYTYTVTMEDGTKRFLHDQITNSGVIHMDVDLEDIVNYNSRGQVISIEASGPYVEKEDPLTEEDNSFEERDDFDEEL